jgi:Na+-transporting NADH:ubiquinone oxidoreductase subunit A
LREAKDVERVVFEGPHPAGNVGTQIHHLDPIRKGEAVWYLQAQDVLRVAKAFVDGVFCPDAFVAITGDGAADKFYAKTVIGAPVAHLAGGLKDDVRVIAGNVLWGTDIGRDGAVGLYTDQLTVVPAGGRRQFLGWMMPGFDKYSFTPVYASAILPKTEVSLDTDTQGSERAIVLNHIYDDLVALDVMTYFLIKAIRAGEIEEMERLGILECAPEDFALAAFACPSKVDVSGIVAQGLEMIEKDG